MHRFFVGYVIESDQVIIDNINDVNHIKRALRVQINEKLEICDAASQEYVVTVEAMDDQIVCKVLEKREVSRESHVLVDLYQGLAKGSKMETIVQKSVELGVHNIYPLSTKRVIVKLDAKGQKKKIERWQKIADEAAKQSKRSHIPEVKPMLAIKDLAGLVSDYDLVLIAYELESSRSLKNHLTDDKKKVAIVIGPEGGFEAEEVDALVDAGGHSVSLGPRILRTETAGITMLSIIQYAIGDISK
ncbi:16S rRNA (uracil(1498)-N(3))-methyltransferase [Acidaminobacter sp. JC074]|uniref:16S rRNA (uracil(1498)-N(3))-methyltransferase n=1 Tax=Acidaminobacter sp. JC074 TaxID=2530199 RepID=UPI001F11356C|nr:16S rRNA (uracil(1498)-N(3))-methyltransferase [Acidaminobacter sp. JC074]MCH4887727.1 16S rRNA (uracil(1498)-N(3))-methyltransferase [Acidaminobacter sp. JC074]